MTVRSYGTLRKFIKKLSFPVFKFFSLIFLNLIKKVHTAHFPFAVLVYMHDILQKKRIIASFVKHSKEHQ